MTQEVQYRTAIVNGEAVPTTKKPKFKSGKPKINNHVSVLGTEVSISWDEDYTEATGSVTLYMARTPANYALIESWQDNPGLNAVRIVDTPAGLSKTFNKMSVLEDIEFDGESEDIEVMFGGGQGK